MRNVFFIIFIQQAVAANRYMCTSIVYIRIRTVHVFDRAVYIYVHILWFYIESVYFAGTTKAPPQYMFTVYS